MSLGSYAVTLTTTPRGPAYSFTKPPDALVLKSQGAEVIRIDPKGHVFWNGREVESDADFRSAMMALADVFLRPR